MIPGGVWCGVVSLSDTNTTPTKIVLSCFGLLVGLWQYKLNVYFALVYL
jgi:hypothetical protein